MTTENPVTFGLVHGSWHGAWCWDLLREELTALGYKSIAIDMPIDDPKANFDTYADVVVDALADESAVVLVGHSRGGNIIPRAAGRLDTKKLIFLASSFEAATLGRPLDDGGDPMPLRNSEAFDKGIIQLGDNMTVFDKKLIRQIFMPDVDKTTQDWAISKWRPQRRTEQEPLLAEWPDVPQEYIVCSEDLVLNPEWQRKMALKLGIKPTEIQDGHSPFLSRPRELAKLLVDLAYT